MRLKKLIKTSFRTMVRRLPRKLRIFAVSQSVRLPGKIPSDMHFRVAQSEKDLEASFRLVYDSYVKLGYCEPNPYKMRATIYHALATTATLLAIHKGRVVGTLTIVRDNRHGLPLEQAFDVSPLRIDANRLAEITSLVIHEDYRREKGGTVLFPLLRLMYHYAYGLFGVNRLVVAVHPKDRVFYESLLLFQDVPDQCTKDYLGAPAICLQLDLDQAEERYLKTYSGRAKNHNLFDFFIVRDMPNIQLPQRTWHKIYDPIVTIEYFEKLFVQKLGLPKRLPSDRRNIASTIAHPRNPRYESTLHVEIHPPGWQESFKGVIKDISKNGFRVFTKATLKPDKIYEFVVKISDNQSSVLRAAPIWTQEHRGVGFRILKASPSWYEYVQFLNRELRGKKVS